MKYTLIILTICLMIFSPKRDIKVEIVEANTGSEEQIITSPDIENRVILTPTPTKTIYVPTSEIEKLICDVFGDDCEDALKIARCESGLRADAVGDNHLVFERDGVEYGRSYGPFQIRHLPTRPDPEKLLNAEFNVQYAKQMFDVQNWSPWTCKKVLSNI